MAKIPTGNFGNVIAQPGQAARVPQGAFDESGLVRAGAAAMQVAGEMVEKERQQDERVKTVNGMAAIENGLADLHDEITRGLADGSIERGKAVETFASQSLSVISDSVNNLDPTIREVIKASSQRTLGRLQNSIGDAVFKRGQQESLAGLNNFLEANQRLSLEDRTLATERSLAAIDGMGPQSGLSPVAIGQLKQKTLEGFADVHATRLVAGARNSIDAVEQALAALDGKDFTDLDPKRREILRSTLESTRFRLETRAENLLLRAEAKGERAIAQIDAQNASGVPATPEQWAEWGRLIAGTAHQDAFGERVQEAKQIQALLREPLESQANYLREREAKLQQEGGTLREKANLDRLKRVVENTQKQLQEAPLLFAQGRTGEIVKPLGLEMLIDPTREQEVAGIFAERGATVSALRNRYGDAVKARVLLPSESDAIAKALDRLGPDQQIEVFGALSKFIGDDTIYQETLGQFAKDSPVKALAGRLAVRGADYVKANLFSPDETITARQTAQLALLGESLLNPTKGQKAQDGKTNTWIMPKKMDMLRRFGDKVGDTFAGTPQAMDAQFELVQATYAGLLASRGGAKNPEIVDSALFEQAIERTTPVMRQGGASFLKPTVGMSDAQFREKLRDVLPDELKAQADRLPLRNVRSNQYAILNGAGLLKDKNGNPLLVTVQP